MRTAAITAAVLMLGLGGCVGGMTETDRLAATHETFAGSVRTITALVDAGVFDDAEIAQLGEFIHAGQEMLARWQAAIELGQPTVGYLDTINAILRELRICNSIAYF